MNPSPSLQGALWSGNQQLATKRQLISSINGLYTDIQDINISSINVTTLGASTFNGSFVSLSTLQLKALDIGGINFSFDLGLGDAIGGALAGLGAAIGGAFVGIGTGVGLAVQGLETGLATLITGRGDNFINNTTFETINGTTQLQISTLGNDFPYYSSIFRSVSSINPNIVPGEQVFLSTIFPAGTTCIRSVSDPLSIITGDSNIATSTIQSFGQWIPFLDPTNTGEDIYARDARFSTIIVYPPIGLYPFAASMSNAATNDVGMYQNITMFPLSNSYNTTSNNNTIANNFVEYSLLTSYMLGNQTQSFISTPYTQYTSTIGNYVGGVYFIESTITSSLTTIPKFIYNGAILGGGNFAICEPDESGFLSTATMDFVAQSSNLFIQWGLAAGNFNSTIAQGTGKRVTWNIPANTSNFIDIPVPQSTIVSNTITSFELKSKPLEMEIRTIASPDNGMGDGKAGFAFDINRATFGAGTTFNNQPNYPYQFNNNVFVNGTLEADLVISLSTFTSTNVVTYFSTFLLEADEAYIDYCQVSTLYSTDLIGANSISTFGIENYSHLSQFSFISTLVVDYQIFGNLTPGVIAYLQDIRGSNGAKITTTNGNFQSLSTTNIQATNILATQATITNPTFSTINLSTIQDIGLTSIYNYPGAITAIAGNNTSPLVALSFKAQLSTNQNNQTRIDYNYNQITGTSNGMNFYPVAVFDPTQPAPYLWDIGNIQNAVMSNATIDNAYISTLNLSSINSSNASYSNLIAQNLQVSTINNENASTLLQYLAMPNTDGATTGSPGVWLQWIDLTGIRPNIRNCPSLDLNIGCIAMGAENAPNGGMTGYIGVREKGQGSPNTYKVVENRTIYAGSGTPALYGGDITFALQKGIDYSANASTMTIWIYGAANNPYFRTGGYASNAFIRGYPY